MSKQVKIMGKTEINSIILAVLLFIALAVTACAGKETEPGKTNIWQSPSLSSCEIWIHNVTVMKDRNQYRTVADEAIRKTVIQICEKAEPFRPITSADETLKEDKFYRYEPVALLENGKERIFIFFTLSDQQLSPDFLYRDQPLVGVIVEPIGKTASEKWFCSLPAADYAMLYELLYTYGGGETVEKQTDW